MAAGAGAAVPRPLVPGVQSQPAAGRRAAATRWRPCAEDARRRENSRRRGGGPSRVGLGSDRRAAGAARAGPGSAGL
eukprot:3075649-Prymnesium_polylepis.1